MKSNSNVVDFSAHLARKRANDLTPHEARLVAKDEFVVLNNWVEERKLQINVLGFQTIDQVLIYVDQFLTAQSISRVNLRQADKLKMDTIVDHSPTMIADLQGILDRVRAYDAKWSLTSKPRGEMLELMAGVVAIDSEISYFMLTLKMLPELLTYPVSTL